MNYPKAVMNKSELMRMGFSEAFLDKIYGMKNQTIAWKDGVHRQSHVMYDTEELEKFRRRQCGVRW